MAAEAQPPTFKCILTGDSGTGKTAFLRRHLTGDFEKEHRPTSWVDVHTLRFHSSKGAVKFQVWDLDGREDLRSSKDGYYVKAHCAIIMFDVSSWVTYGNVFRWHDEVRRVCGEIPVVTCGNKTDSRNRFVIQSVMRDQLRRTGLHYEEICVRSSSRLETPFVRLAKKLLKDPHLELVPQPAGPPPAAPRVAEHRTAEENSILDLAMRTPLPDDPFD